jgi:hypothetical protein
MGCKSTLFYPIRQIYGEENWFSAYLFVTLQAISKQTESSNGYNQAPFCTEADGLSGHQAAAQRALHLGFRLEVAHLYGQP